MKLPYGVGFVDQDPSGTGTQFVYNLRFPGQYYDVETGLSYNTWRDYDPATGRYVESDPIGLRGGIDTYEYAGDQPTMRVDPNGLFQLTVATTWQMDDNVQGGVTRDPINRAKCVCTKCGGSWVLTECSSFLLIRVRLQPGLKYPGLADFIRNSEQQHVDDLRAGVDDIRKAGQLEEARQRQRQWSSQSDCENDASKAVTREIVNVRDWYFDDSRRRWDDTGLHRPHTPFGMH
jgi:RHS repeat-associated protein